MNRRKFLRGAAACAALPAAANSHEPPPAGLMVTGYAGTKKVVTLTYDPLAVDLVGDRFVHPQSMEVGAFPTSYIKTEGSTVTRNADAISATELGWFNQTVTQYFDDHED